MEEIRFVQLLYVGFPLSTAMNEEFFRESNNFRIPAQFVNLNAHSETIKYFSSMYNRGIIN